MRVCQDSWWIIFKEYSIKVIEDFFGVYIASSKHPGAGLGAAKPPSRLYESMWTRKKSSSVKMGQCWCFKLRHVRCIKKKLAFGIKSSNTVTLAVIWMRINSVANRISGLVLLSVRILKQRDETQPHILINILLVSSERTSERANERTSERANERTSERAINSVKCTQCEYSRNVLLNSKRGSSDFSPQHGDKTRHKHSVVHSPRNESGFIVGRWSISNPET